MRTHSTATYGGLSYGSSPTWDGIAWANFTAGVSGNAAGTAETQTLTFNYEVTTNPGESIVGLDQLIITDIVNGYVGLSATENVYNSSNNLIATLNWNYSSGSTGQWLATASSDLRITLTVTASTPASDSSTANDYALFSGIRQGFETAQVSVEKQMSVDGGKTWIDASAGVMADPNVLVGSTVLYRVVVTNNSENSLMLTGAQVTDTGGPSPFMFGGSETFSLAAGATITSDVSSTLAAAGYHLDTATLTGTITDSRNNSSISGSDTADYTGETYSATLQKQIDVNGTG